jgi:dihydrofolate reductase
MKATVFIATSLDGFIARKDGALDWLPVNGGEPHGYDEFIATVDALVIGRKTLETVLKFDAWPYAQKPVVVLSVDGGITIQGFLKAGLIQRLIITRIPVLLGSGIPLFGTLSNDMRFEHIATRSYATGMVQSEYSIVA